VSVTPVILPKLGLTMDEGTLVAWLKKVGDRVEAGEILFEVETDKATMAVEAPVAGYVRRLLASVGEEIPVTQGDRAHRQHARGANRGCARRGDCGSCK